MFENGMTISFYNGIAQLESLALIDYTLWPAAMSSINLQIYGPQDILKMHQMQYFGHTQ